MRKILGLSLLALSSTICGYRAVAQAVIDPKVKEVIQKALESSNDLRIKSYETEKVNLEITAVKANKLPHVSAMGAYGYLQSNGSLDLPTLSLPILNVGLFEGATDFRMNTQVAFAGMSVRQVIFSGLQIPNAEQALKEKVKVQNFLTEVGKESLAKEIAASFDQLMLLHEVDRLIVDSEKRLVRERDKVNKGIANGLAIPYDRDKLKLALLELEEKKIELAGNRRLLIKKIQQETLLSSAQLEGIRYQLSPVYLSTIPENVAERSELKALAASGRAYEFLYKKEKGSALPTVFAFGSANYLNLFNTDLRIKDRPLVGDINLSSHSFKGSPNLMLGIGLKWDVYTGGAHQSKVRQVQLEQKINSAKQLEAEEKLGLLLDKNKVNYQITNQKLKVGAQQLDVAKNNLQIASRQLQEGLIDVTELLASENDYYKVNLNYFSNVLQQRVAALELLHASGRLLQSINE